MTENGGRPVVVTILAWVHMLVGSAVAALVVGRFAMGHATSGEQGVPFVLLVQVAIAVLIGPGVGVAMFRGRKWAWYLGTSCWVVVAIVGPLVVPSFLDWFGQSGRGITRALAPGAAAWGALAAITLFTRSVAGFFGIPRKAVWAPLVLEILVSVALVFGIQWLGDGTRSTSENENATRLVGMGERMASSAEDVEFMLERLANGGAKERVPAAWALGRTGRGDVIPALLEAAREDDDDNVRINAIASVAELGDQEVLDDLLGFLDDRAADIRSAALRGLAHEKFAGAVERVGQLVLDDESLRANAVDALGNMGCTDAVPILLNVAEDPVEDVRTRVAYALGRLGDRRAVPALIGLLDDRRWTVRANAAQALGMIGDSDAGPALMNLNGDPNTQVRAAASAALERLQ